MTLGWRARQLTAFVLLAAVLIAVTGFLGLTSAVQLGARQASTEADLVTGAVRRELARLTSAASGTDLSGARRSAGLAATFDDAIVLAPSIISVAVTDPNGWYVAHTDSASIGTRSEAHAPLPDVRSMRAAVATLWELHRRAPDYQRETSLLHDGQPFATVQVVMSGTFLWTSVEDAMSRGLVTAVTAVVLALVSGILVSRVLTGRVRELEAGVRALTEGQLDVRLSERGHDEFTRLAQALNVLGDRFRESADAERGAVPGSPQVSTVLDRLGRMASGVAHELRNHLQRASLELAVAASQTGEERDATLDRARRAIQSVEGSVTGFLRMASVGALNVETTNVHALLRDVGHDVEARAHLQSVELVVEADAPGVVEMDALVVKQALGNAIQNALEALEGRTDGRIVLAAARDATSVRMWVSDNGPGMTAETRRQAFDPYFTTRPKGSGIGLALIAQTAELHRGQVRLETGPTGTTLIMELPCAHDA